MLVHFQLKGPYDPSDIRDFLLIVFLAAFLWQLMRYNMLHLLRTIKYKGKEVSDADILEWANNKVKASGRKSRMESFKVIFMLHLSR